MQILFTDHPKVASWCFTMYSGTFHHPDSTASFPAGTISVFLCFISLLLCMLKVYTNLLCYLLWIMQLDYQTSFCFSKVHGCSELFKASLIANNFCGYKENSLVILAFTTKGLIHTNSSNRKQTMLTLVCLKCVLGYGSHQTFVALRFFFKQLSPFL